MLGVKAWAVIVGLLCVALCAAAHYVIENGEREHHWHIEYHTYQLLFVVRLFSGGIALLCGWLALFSPIS